ncbi:hypothetical protein FJTKL_13416 [Diaporthe vaccinii]|uniref:Uncharacterized protein n=1 Tax=Diaporthe vaccinii TaxID=105482 RepID=A0ABR4EAS4_9PEZI
MPTLHDDALGTYRSTNDTLLDVVLVYNLHSYSIMGQMLEKRECNYCNIHILPVPSRRPQPQTVPAPRKHRDRPPRSCLLHTTTPSIFAPKHILLPACYLVTNYIASRYKVGR